MSTMTPEQLMATALANPDEALLALDKMDAEERLLPFIKMMWPVLEPGRQFVHGWAVEAICDHLEAVSKGQIRKLLINVPPGCMKSLTTCVFWPAWEWGPRNRPDLRYVCASYTSELTIRDNRRCRQLMQSQMYQKLWGDRFTFATDQDAKVKFENDKRGFKIATSVGGVGTGERGDRFIIDDPHNVKDAESDVVRESAIQWFTEVVPTRVTDPNKASFIIIMQRVHERDVSGLVIAQDLGYEVLCLPMEYEKDHPVTKKYFSTIGFKDRRTADGELLWEERFNRESVDDLKKQLRAWGGVYAEAGQLQQRPSPRGGGMFKKSYFQIVDDVPYPGQGRSVRAWDLAASTGRSAAYTVGVKMRKLPNKAILIEDVIRFRGTPYDVEQKILETARADGKKTAISIPQDPGQAGKAQKAHFAQLLEGYEVHFSLESGSKEERAAPLASQGEGGNLLMLRAHWNDQYLAEAVVFPAGEFKDQIDASSRAYHEILKRRDFSIPAGPQVLDSSLPTQNIAIGQQNFDDILPDALIGLAAVEE